MGKVITLLFLALLTLASLVGYLSLTKMIAEGNLKIAYGEKQLDQGEKMLAKGKARLAKGERELSTSKGVFNGFSKVSLIGAVIMPVSLVVTAVSNKAAQGKIAEGDQLVAKGNQKVQTGEKQLAAGKVELRSGIERLNQAKGMRTICAIGIVVFSTVLLVLGFFWRRSLIKLLKSTDI